MEMRMKGIARRTSARSLQGAELEKAGLGEAFVLAVVDQPNALGL